MSDKVVSFIVPGAEGSLGTNVDIYSSGDLLSNELKTILAPQFDELSVKTWGIDKDFFRSVGSDLFSSEDVVCIVIQDAKLVGFSIYRWLDWGGRKVLFQRYTCFDPMMQGKGLYSRISDTVIQRSVAKCQSPMYFAWRTRNPIIWFKNVSFCAFVSPDILGHQTDENLDDSAMEICGLCYPGMIVDRYTLRMREVYPGDTGYILQPHHPIGDLDRLFFATEAAKDRHSSMFGCGIVRQ